MSNYSLTALISIPEEAGYFFPDRHFQYISRNVLFNVMIDKLEAIPQISKIILNTDSARIKSSYARSGKVKVIDAYRAEPQEIELELTSDKVTAAMLKHAEGEHFLQLGPIFPFLKHQTIDDVIEAYDRYVVNPEDHHSYDSVFTIRTLNRRYFDTDTDFIREDRPNTFVEDGILHVFNRTTFLAGSDRKVGKKPYVRGVDEIENLAIDSEENHRLAVYIDEHRYLFTRVFGR
jgi:CMP-N-acetylneuraminic acid synthetase